MSFLKLLFIGFREGMEGRGENIAFIWLLLYVSRLEIEPTTLAYWDNAQTDKAAQAGPVLVSYQSFTVCAYQHSAQYCLDFE